MAAPEDILDGLEERLLSHSKAFESLLALTPAQEYYGSQIVDGKDPSEQWRAKKQTKEEKRLAKKAKLDPANQKSALDVMKEREKKRKRELGMDDEDKVVQETAGHINGGKRQKVEESPADTEERRRMKAEQRKEKREKKKAKAAKLKEKRELKKAAKLEAEEGEPATAKKGRTPKVAKLDEADADVADEDEDDDTLAHTVDAADMEKMDLDGLMDPDDAESVDEADDAAEDGAASLSTAPSSPDVDGIVFDTSANHSTASSLSSIIPPSDIVKTKPTPQSKQAPAANAAPAKSTVDTTATCQPRDIPSGVSSPRLVLPNIDSEELQERLRARIEELRARRKADGPDGKAPKSRQDLLDQRRKKEEQRKAHKKELRRKAKEEEARKQEERLRGSGSPLSVDIFSPRSPKPQQETNFSFSRLAFDDGTVADSSLTGLVDAPRKKGPQDARTALLAAEGKEKRLAGYDETKRAEIAEKDLWLNAKKRAHGERVRDDTSLLKKALKRKEKGKGKSEKEWEERKEAVVKGKEMKQKKREGNLQKRREGKGEKGKQGGNSKGSAKKGKPKGRPGFEGRFKA